MSWVYPYLTDIDLFVRAKISEKDARRQESTARAILNRLHKQPGIILADEVGMGKTFVSLAVAVSVALSDKRKKPVVIMIPSGISDKWNTDFGVFTEKCLPATYKEKLNCGKAENVVELLKLLDDNSHKRKKIIFLTHGAFYRSMKDKWLRLAIIKRALYNRKSNAAVIYRSLERFGSELLEFKYDEKRNPGLVKRLLNSDFIKWKKILVESESLNETDDDPIPAQIVKELWKIPTNEFDSLVYQLHELLPKKRSGNFRANLMDARTKLKDEINNIWRLCLIQINPSLPLLILDEAHHLKNARTRFASLFHSEEGDEEARHQSKGSLEGIFERMLFLTATPFQLGHHELCSVLQRFSGIDWKKSIIDGMDRNVYKLEIDNLNNALNDTQRAALAFDEEWGQLGSENLILLDKYYEQVSDWWKQLCSMKPQQLNLQQQMLMQRFISLKTKMELSEVLLKKYVVRHIRDNFLTGENYSIQRRTVMPGNGISKSNQEKSVEGNKPLQNDSVNKGLLLSDDSLLPFLLAARLSSLRPDARPVFAEGLASSYEAFLDTRKAKENNRLAAEMVDIDEDDLSDSLALKANELDTRWYFEQMEGHVRSAKVKDNHPKMSATVERAVDLWMHGEKVLIFCHYIATTKALHRKISLQLHKQIEKTGSEKLECEPSKVWKTFDRIGKNMDSVDGLLRKAFDKKISSQLKQYSGLIEYTDIISNVIRRYFRTPSFLARFYPLGQKGKPREMIEHAFEKKDNSGLTLHEIIDHFLQFLEIRCGSDERLRYLEALNSIQTGHIRVVDSVGSSDLTSPIVRVVTGSTDMITRQNLMLTFNTPFYPDILVASSVMAEGVDLHLNCRHIIHHDLSWNPSTLEQRTGRIDRIGAKVEHCKLPIQIYLPYIAETQDEKMYKVVMYRDRWFNILMGEDYKDDFQSTEMIANRFQLPDELVKELSLNLKVD